MHGVDVKMCKLKKTWKGIIWASFRSPFPETGDLNFIQITSKLRKTYAWKLNMMYKNDFYDKKYKSCLKSSQIISLQPPKSTQFLLFFFDPATNIMLI